jgi:transcriptional regulator with XRE-family HTH domain
MNLKKSIKTGFVIREKNQQELAEFIGKKQATVSYYANGRIDPPLSVVINIAEFFGVKTSTFIEWGENEIN